MKRIFTGYVPRPWAQPLHHKFTQRNCLVVHRRGGKTVVAINHIVHKGVTFDKMDSVTGSPLLNPQYAYLATTIGQAEKVAWPYLKHYTSSFPGVKYNEQKLKASFPHPRGTCTIYCLGADNFDAHRGMYWDGYVPDEFADMHPDVRDKVFLPALRDRRGWELVIGTPKGDNSFKKLYMDYLINMQAGDPNYFACLKSVYETGIFTPKEIEEMKKEMSEEAFAQEMLCDFNAAPAGYYYQRYMDEAVKENRITSVPFDPSQPVSTYWDLGVSDSTTIWFVQELGKEIHVIDYLEGHGMGLEYYVKKLNEKPYNYNFHVFPHDVKQRELTSAKPRLEYLINLGVRNIEVLPKSNSIADDINAVRLVLPKCWFDREKCKLGIQHLRDYQRKWDAKNHVYSDSPLHNQASHGADGFRVFALHYRPGFGRYWNKNEDFTVPQQAKADYNVLGW